MNIREDRKKRRLEICRRITGGAIVAIIVFFLARHRLVKSPAYQKIEQDVVQTLRLDRAGERIARAIGTDEADEEARRRTEEARERRRRRAAERPRLEVAIPPRPTEELHYRVTPLVDREYFHAVRDAIGRAESSIYVAMYLIMPDPPRGPATRLLDELIAAARRGVKVTVALNHPGRLDNPEFIYNRDAIAYLRDGGVNAHFSDPGKSLHDKSILIDDRILIVGNHNWTREALTIHLELALLVEVDRPDPTFARHFASIRLARLEDTPEGRLELIERLYEELLKRSRVL